MGDPYGQFKVHIHHSGVFIESVQVCIMAITMSRSGLIHFTVISTAPPKLT